MTEDARWRAVGAALGAGAAYDLLFGIGILAFTVPLAALLRLEVPAEPTYLRLNGVFLLMLAAIYGAAARHPERCRAVAPIAGAGRVLGFLVFFISWRSGGPITFLVLGVADLAIGVVTLALWRRAAALSG